MGVSRSPEVTTVSSYFKCLRYGISIVSSEADILNIIFVKINGPIYTLKKCSTKWSDIRWSHLHSWLFYKNYVVIFDIKLLSHVSLINNICQAALILSPKISPRHLTTATPTNWPAFCKHPSNLWSDYICKDAMFSDDTCIHNPFAVIFQIKRRMRRLVSDTVISQNWLSMWKVT